MGITIQILTLMQTVIQRVLSLINQITSTHSTATTMEIVYLTSSCSPNHILPFISCLETPATVTCTHSLKLSPWLSPTSVFKISVLLLFMQISMGNLTSSFCWNQGNCRYIIMSILVQNFARVQLNLTTSRAPLIRQSAAALNRSKELSQVCFLL